MDVTQEKKDDQATLWNGLAGRAWVEAQDLVDQILQPLEELLVHEVSTVDGVRRVLDVGCGTGSTTVAIARLLGAHGHVAGIDISEPMIAAARARAERAGTDVNFICANAETHAFDPTGFDMIVSRFGVMFFDDFVRAFENLRRAAREGAKLRVLVWRSPSENPFMTTAERAAAPLLANLPPRKLEGPGQFAFADRARVSRILEESGWTGIEIEPMDVPCTAPEKELVRYFSTLGPVGRALQEADDRTRVQVIETVRTAFDPYVHGAEVRFTAACWMVSSTRA